MAARRVRAGGFDPGSSACLNAADTYGKKGDYLTGANIAGFIKVANAMLAYGIV